MTPGISSTSHLPCLHVCLTAAIAAVFGCSAPAVLPSLQAAEQAEKAGDHQAALRSYSAAIVDCPKIPTPRIRRRDCAAAHLHRAELLVTLGEQVKAVEAYEAIEAALPDDRVSIAEGLYRAGSLRLALKDEVGGYRQLWRTVTDFPDEQFAGDALRLVVTDGRRRNPQQLYSVLGPLVDGLRQTRIADNVWFFLAEIAHDELKQPRLALGNYDQIATLSPKSGLTDESYWRGAEIALALGDPLGAVERLRKLLATREVAFGAGSYFSVYLDDSQLKVGIVLRDGLGQLTAAADAFKTLPRHYPVSILRDDALFELAVTTSLQKKPLATCNHLQRLAEQFPDSKYLLEKGPALAAASGCTSR